VTIRVYIVPALGDGLSPKTAWRPAYVPVGVRASWLSYGGEGVYIWGGDVTPAQHTAIAANSPITVVPADLSSTVGAGLATVQAALASWNIPSAWVTSGMTYNEVVRGVCAIFHIANRLLGKFGSRLLPGGITLSTTIAQLTQTQRDRLQAVADSYSLSTAAVTGSTTIAQFLRILAAQWALAIKLGALIL